MEKKPNFRSPVVMFGQAWVGKSNIIHRWVHQHAYDWRNTGPRTAKVSFTQKSYQVVDHIIEMKLWEFHGNAFIPPHFCQMVCNQAEVFVMVYDITDRASFDYLLWLTKVVKTNKWPKEGAEMLLVGNKCDLEEEREVSHEEGRLAALERGMQFFEVSAKTTENIRYVIEFINKGVVKRGLNEAPAKKEKSDKLRPEVVKRNVTQATETEKQKKPKFEIGRLVSLYIWIIWLLGFLRKVFRFKLPPKMKTV